MNLSFFCDSYYLRINYKRKEIYIYLKLTFLQGLCLEVRSEAATNTVFSNHFFFLSSYSIYLFNRYHFFRRKIFLFV